MAEPVQEPLKIAITGASGSLGEAILDLLIPDDEIGQIVAVDLAAPRRHAGSPKLNYIRMDVRDAKLKDVFQGLDAVMHLAFVVEKTGGMKPEEVESINVGGTQNVFRSADAADVHQVVYASSVASYGIHASNIGKVLTEDAPRVASEDFYYSRHKTAVEHWLDDFEKSRPEMTICRLRPSIFLSERSETRKVRFMFRSPVHVRMSAINPDLQLTHEDDVAQAFVLALKKKARGAFNVAAEGTIKFGDLGRELGRPSIPVPGNPLKLVKIAARAGLAPMDPIWFDVMTNGELTVSAAKIRKELRWQPRFETSGDVIRAVAGLPNGKASHALKWFWGPMAAFSSVVRRIPMPPDIAGQARGFEGDINMVFTGEQPGAYRLHIGTGSFSIHEGTVPNARATVLMKTSTFHDILSGRINAQSATFSGKVRVRGEGETVMVAMGSIDAFRKFQKMKNLVGTGARLYSRFLLKDVPKTTDSRTPET